MLYEVITVMMRGTFANIRIKNRMVDREGGYTRAWPEGVEMPIYDAAMHYQEAGTPLVVFAGKDYGTGSSRDCVITSYSIHYTKLYEW